VPNKQMLLSLSCQFKNRRERVDKVVLCIFDWQTVSEKISLYLSYLLVSNCVGNAAFEIDAHLTKICTTAIARKI